MTAIKLILSKGWVMFLLATVALGIAGAGYAAWTASLHVEGTVRTGNVDVVWDQQEDRDFVEVLQPDGSMVAQPVPDDKRGAADCKSDLQPGQTAHVVNVQVSGAYPSYSCVVLVGAIVTGSVPVHISKIDIMATDAATGADALNKEVTVDVIMGRKFPDPTSNTKFRCDFRAPVGVSTQLHRGDRFCALMRIHVNQTAKQSHNYTAGLWIDLIQWNEAAAQTLPPTLSVQPTLSGNVLTLGYNAPGALITAHQEVNAPNGDSLGMRSIGSGVVQTELLSMSLTGFIPNKEILLTAKISGNIIVICCVSFGPSVQLVGLEAVQAVQDLEDNVQVVQDKRTLVRAHLQPSFGGAIAAVVAELHGTGAGGAPLPGSPLAMLNPGGTMTAQPGALNFRGTLNASSASFELPASWRTGTIELRVQGVSHSLTCLEKADGDNDCRVGLSFNITDPPNLKWVKVKYTTAGTPHEPTTSNVTELKDQFKAIMPLASFDSENGNLNMGAGVPTLAGVNTNLNVKRLFECIFSFFTDCNRLYYGALVDSGLGGLADNIPGSSSSGDMPQPNTSTAYGRNRHAHEVAHTLGRSHAVNQADNGTSVINGVTYKDGYCGEVADLGAPEFPYTDGSNATIGPMNLGVQRLIYGWDSHRNVIIDPTQTFELLSYCGGTSATSGQSRWISKFTYDGVRTAINGRFSGPETELVPIPGAQYLMVSGVVFEGSQGTGEIATNVLPRVPAARFTPFNTIPSNIRPPRPAQGPFLLRTFDLQGVFIEEVSFMPELYSTDISKPGEEDVPQLLGSFVVAVNDTEGKVGKVQVHLGGPDTAPVATMTRSANAPVVTGFVAEPIQGGLRFMWQGSDTDVDSLSYLLLLDQSACKSADRQGEVHVLGVNYVDSFFDVFVGDLEFQDQRCSKFAVIASDGFNSSQVGIEFPEQ